MLKHLKGKNFIHSKLLLVYIKHPLFPAVKIKRVSHIEYITLTIYLFLFSQNRKISV